MKSLSSGWSFLRDSEQLRSAIQYRMQADDVTISKVAKALDVDADRISKYLRGVKPSLTNWQVIILANYLRLEVELNVKTLSPTPTL